MNQFYQASKFPKSDSEYVSANILNDLCSQEPEIPDILSLGTQFTFANFGAYIESRLENFLSVYLCSAFQKSLQPH